MVSTSADIDICAVLFDYGGVLAEEGFREGLKAIGSAAGLDAEEFFRTASEVVHDSGYLTGRAEEGDFWNLVRQRTGVCRPDEEMRGEILPRFQLRPWMMEIVSVLRSRKYQICILSDQTDWLDTLNERDDFFKDFDQVFNSYRLGKSKMDPTVFGDVAALMGVPPSCILFIDDNAGNVERAQSKGLHAILYRDEETFRGDLNALGLLGESVSGDVPVCHDHGGPS